MTNHVMRAKARELRREHGVAVNKIAEMLGVSKSSVSLWVRDIELTPDQVEKLKKSQSRIVGQMKGAKANQEKAAARRMTYQQHGRERIRNSSDLYKVGCMLYWAEGAKHRTALYFVNTDAAMMQLFIRFLREEMNVQNDECGVIVHCYSPDPIEQRRIQQHWLDVLTLPETCLKNVLVKPGGEFRVNKLEYGICGLSVYKTGLVQEIYGAIQEYSGWDRPEWLHMNKRDQHVT